MKPKLNIETKTENALFSWHLVLWRQCILLNGGNARAILKDMGYDIPSRITRGDMSIFLSNAPTLSVDEVMMFVEKARGIQ